MAWSAIATPIVVLAALALIATSALAATTGTPLASRSAPTGGGPTISPMGTLWTHTNQPSQQQEKITITPAAAGDVLALAVETKFPSGASFTAAGVSGGGVATWTKAFSLLPGDRIHGLELWWGVVQTSGRSTVTVNFTAGSTGRNSASATSLDIQELASSAGSLTTWSTDSTGKIDPGAATTIPSYPTLAPTAGPAAYVGFLIVPGSVGPGSTPGVVYQVDARGNQIVYDTTVAAAITPKARSSAAQAYSSIGMLIKATSPTTTTVPPTTTTVPPTTTTVPPTTTTVPPTTTTVPPTTTTVPPPLVSATVRGVGHLYTHTVQGAQHQETLSVSPAASGDVLALAIETKFPGTPSFSAATVSGGGVTTWNKATSFLTSDGFHGQELWWGTVTSPGTKSLTATYTSGSTAGNADSASSLDVQEFASSSGAATVWSVDTTGKLDTGSASNSPRYPTLTPGSATEAYFGYIAVPGSIGSGSTPGVIYQTDARGNQIAYDVSVSTTITPTATSSSAQTFASAGMLLKAV